MFSWPEVTHWWALLSSDEYPLSPGGRIRRRPCGAQRSFQPTSTGSRCSTGGWVGFKHCARIRGPKGDSIGALVWRKQSSIRGNRCTDYFRILEADGAWTFASKQDAGRRGSQTWSKASYSCVDASVLQETLEMSVLQRLPDYSCLFHFIHFFQVADFTFRSNVWEICVYEGGGHVLCPALTFWLLLWGSHDFRRQCGLSLVTALVWHMVLTHVSHRCARGSGPCLPVGSPVWSITRTVDKQRQVCCRKDESPVHSRTFPSLPDPMLPSLLVTVLHPGEKPVAWTLNAYPHAYPHPILTCFLIAIMYMFATTISRNIILILFCYFR